VSRDFVGVKKVATLESGFLWRSVVYKVNIPKKVICTYLRYL
jgi:hypothetical protein